MKIFLDSIGCRLNQSEIERIAGQFRSAGHDIVAAAADADLVVLNSCAVTSKAAADSRQAVRRAARESRAEIIVTGCWSTLEPDQALSLPRVGQVIANEKKDDLVWDFLGLDKDIDLDFIQRKPLPGDRMRTRAFIKVQDGCNNACTFCITRIARGRSVSRPAEKVIADVNSAIAGGAKEVVLTGVNLGSWGRDMPDQRSFTRLVQTILDATDIPRLRLSSLEPWDLGEEFFILWEDERLCPHLHLSLQSGSQPVLKRMGRKGTLDDYQRIVGLARSARPDIALTTDVIVGFPGEIDQYFKESIDFIEEVGFAGGHVFSFSPRPGTAAAAMQDQVGEAEKKARSKIFRARFAQAANAYQNRFIGRQVSALWETAARREDGNWLLSGLSEHYLRVDAVAKENLWNEISKVRLEGRKNRGLSGRILSSNNSVNLDTLSGTE